MITEFYYIPQINSFLYLSTISPPLNSQMLLVQEVIIKARPDSSRDAINVTRLQMLPAETCDYAGRTLREN